MTDKTLFQKIFAGEIPSQLIYQDELVFAIRDIDPKAPTHVLIIPIKPIPSLADIVPEDAPILSAALFAAQKIAKDEGLVDGWRLVANTGKIAGQTVPHLHFHLLGGRPLGWPPG